MGHALCVCCLSSIMTAQQSITSRFMPLRVQGARLWSASRPDMRTEQISSTSYVHGHRHAGRLLSNQAASTAQPLQQAHQAAAGGRIATARTPDGIPPGAARPLHEQDQYRPLADRPLGHTPRPLVLIWILQNSIGTLLPSAQLPCTQQAERAARL
jgi:hypothetical protein